MKTSRLFGNNRGSMVSWAPPPHALGANPAEVQESRGDYLRQALALAFARNPDLAALLGSTVRIQGSCRRV
jgi:hypothetical protein